MPFEIMALPEKIRPIVAELSKKYEFEKINLKGANGYVIIAVNRLIERRVAIKFYYWGDGAHPEPRTLSTLASDNILRVHDAAAIDNEDAYFVTEFCEGGDLDDLLFKGPIGVIKAVDYIQDIASGASFLHAAGYIHRDLKPSNIFCDVNKKLLIGDFGSVVAIGAKGYVETFSTHSPIYRTPEKIESGRDYPQGDIYQIGLVFYQLLGGKLSYNLEDWLTKQQVECYNSLPEPSNQLYANEIIESLILKGKILDYSSLPPWCPKPLISIIRKCTHLDMSKRFDSVTALKGKLNNIRADLPNWRVSPELVLARPKVDYRVRQEQDLFFVEKLVRRSMLWRRIRTIAPASLAEIIEAVEALKV
jgi:eukaryotic-like serine/threonine-protein kinase